MPVREDLLKILCCPLTKMPLKVLDEGAVAQIKQLIGAGQVQYENGAEVKESIEEALVTVDHKRLYVVRDSIPVMLVDESIPADQFGDDILGEPPAEDA